MTVIVLRSVAAPGQYSVYLPAPTFTANEPPSPAATFSFSARMRSPESSSTSLTAVASLFWILKVRPPAAKFGAVALAAVRPP